MALLPSISTLVTVHLDSHLGANNGANGAAGALAIILKIRALVAGCIQFARLHNDLLRAEMYAKPAFLAKFAGYDDFSPGSLNYWLFIRHDYPLIRKPGLHGPVSLIILCAGLMNGK
jgi:hypothetical protein